MLDIEMPQFQFLSERGVRTDADGFKGHVVKTMRLRGPILSRVGDSDL